MLYDLRSSPVDGPLEYDVCIVGGGAAGITLARRFIGTPFRVCLLESGGDQYDATNQSFYEGESVGFPYYGLASCRLRYFGGTTNHWAGACAPLNRMDFEPRAWVPHSGWPIGLDDLYPWYAAAQSVCQVGAFQYDVDDWSDEYHRYPHFDPDRLMVRFWQLSPPTRFGRVYGPELERADNVDVYQWANVTNLNAERGSGRLRSVSVNSVDGHSATASARHFVVACGGIENARILLASNDVHPDGIGNQNDVVGRFFMEHLRVRTGSVLALDADRLGRTFRAFVKTGSSHEVLPGICPTDEQARTATTLNYGITIESRARDDGYAALRRMTRSLGSREWPDANDVTGVLSDPGGVAGGFSAKLRGEPYLVPVRELFLFTQSEQAPDPASRVMLSDERDRLGVPRTRLDWRVGELDWHTLQVANRTVGEELGRLGMGRVRLADWILDDTIERPDDLIDGCHHMGTTRMSASPRTGVVDGDCRVHGMDNLWVAGSSVFPTGGYANPTLTIVALALRLGERIERELRQTL